MTKDSETSKTETVVSGEKRPIGEGFLRGLNEILRDLIGLQQSQAEGLIQLSPKTNQEIEAEIARIKRDAAKMEKDFAKVEAKLKKDSSQKPPQSGGRE